jgi:DNA-directed RNA polymerase subunit RPC12/RpoP
MFGPPSRCRDCGSTRFHRSRQRDWFRVLAACLFLRPYRCEACGRRVWRFGLPGRTTARPQPVVAAQLARIVPCPDHPPQPA